MLDEDGGEIWTVAKLRVMNADTSAVIVVVPRSSCPAATTRCGSAD
jgi:hypothetical protein